jgi:hypothetical protein
MMSDPANDRFNVVCVFTKQVQNDKPLNAFDAHTLMFSLNKAEESKRATAGNAFVVQRTAAAV